MTAAASFGKRSSSFSVLNNAKKTTPPEFTVTCIPSQIKAKNHSIKNAFELKVTWQVAILYIELNNKHSAQKNFLRSCSIKNDGLAS